MHIRPFAFVAALALPTLSIVGACSNQGEGQVCDVSSDDCQAGLVCQPQGALGYRCCPVQGSGVLAATPICSPNHPGVADANVPPEESGADGGGASEAGPDTSSQPDQSAAEASPDAHAESSSATDAADGSEAAATGAEASDGPTE